MRECVAEGTIQAYVDGELSPEAAQDVALHAAGCATCAAAVNEAENELALLATAFEPELSLPVPSARLRDRLDAAIGEMRSQALAPEKASSRSFKAWLAAFVPSFNFAPRQSFGFASLVAVVAFAAIFGTLALRRNENQSSLVAVINGAQDFDLQQTVSEAPVADDRASNDPHPPTRPIITASRRANNSRPKANAVAQPSSEELQPLPGERSYMNTIASLSNIIENNGESALKPSLRADYERNLALVDQAITATRRTARRNPKDSDAAEFLYSSYQSKIELLSTIAEQGQMLAVAR